MSKKLKLSDIRTDGGTQPRSELDSERVEQMADQLHELPPVDVFMDGNTYWLADGFHRYNAHKMADADVIACNIHQGDLQAAQWFSYGANKTHDQAGLRRTNADKERAVRAALSHPKASSMSDRAIADHVGVSGETVRKYRSSCQTLATENRTGRDGKSYPATRTLASEIGEDDKPTKPEKQYINGDTGEEIGELITVTTKSEKKNETRDTLESYPNLYSALKELKDFSKRPAYQLSPSMLQRIVGDLESSLRKVLG